MAKWSNWAGNVTASPRTIAMPRDVNDVVALVNSLPDGGRVKAVGAGHSFTAIAQPSDVQVRLDHLCGLVNVNPRTGRVRVKAGTRLYDLVPQLAEHGLALANMGDIDQQTIAGAISTATHGTGLRWGGFGQSVVGGEMVTGTGELLRWSAPSGSQPGENEHLVPALAVTLGALGILTEVELQCVPLFSLHAKETPSTLSAELADLDQTLEDVDHYEFFWFPHTDKVMTKRNTRLEGATPTSPLPGWKRKVDDEFLSNTVFEWVNRLSAAAPQVTPHINKISASALSAREYSDRSDAVYASPRTVRFRESELSVPLDAAEPLLRELQTWVARTGEPVAFPVEVRWAAADDRWMSSAYGRPSCYIAIHQYHRVSHERYFNYFWQIARDYEARPHWGKMHNFDAEYLRSVYPKFDDFVALRETYDPKRVFTNAYLDRVLGA